MKKREVALFDSEFTKWVEYGGVSYALLCKESEAKFAYNGRKLSVSELARAERTVRTLVHSYGSDKLTGAQVADIAQVISESKMYASFLPGEPPNETYPAELNAGEWVTHPTKRYCRAAAPVEPAPEPIGPVPDTSEPVSEARPEAPQKTKKEASSVFSVFKLL